MPVPATPNGNPDYVAYYAQCATALSTLLATRLPVQHENDSFLMPLRMFFVRDPNLFHGLAGGVAQLQADAKQYLTGASRPNRKELDHIRLGDPLGLFSILRVHHSFIELSDPRAAGSHTHGRLARFGLSTGLRAGAIVPSAHRFDRSVYQNLCAQHGVTSAQIANRLPGKGFQRNPSALLQELEAGYTPQGSPTPSGANARKKRVGGYRVTERLATMLSEAISEETQGAVSPPNVMAQVFDTDPRTGPGQGKMTQALPLNLGNLLP